MPFGKCGSKEERAVETPETKSTVQNFPEKGVIFHCFDIESTSVGKAKEKIVSRSKFR